MLMTKQDKENLLAKVKSTTEDLQDILSQLRSYSYNEGATNFNRIKLIESISELKVLESRIPDFAEVPDSIFDASNNQIKVGSLVMYPCRMASSCFLRQGVVTNIKGDYVSITSKETGASNLRHKKDVMVVTA